MSTCAADAGHGDVFVMWKTVSEDCNLACDYCYYSTCGGRIGRRVRRIDSALLEKFIGEYMAYASRRGGVATFIWQGGEPLLAGLDFFREVVELQIKYARPGMMVSNAVQTNGTLIDEEWARFFRKYNFLVGVSVDGPKEIHDARRVTGSGKGSYDLVMRGIGHLRDAGAEFNILTVVHDGNVDKGRELMEFYRRENFGYVQFIPCMDFRAQEPDRPARYQITPEQYGRFLCETFDVWYNDGRPEISVRFFDNVLGVYLHREAELCIHHRSCPKGLILEQNGDAYPCDFYIHGDYRLGNAGTDSLEALLASPVFDAFLRMKPALPPKCASCPWLRLCHGGCPRNRRWGPAGEALDTDYFCAAYMRFYGHAHERMQKLAWETRKNWMREYKATGLKWPGRNDPCVCGSGRKFKVCCAPAAAEISR